MSIFRKTAELIGGGASAAAGSRPGKWLGGGLGGVASAGIGVGGVLITTSLYKEEYGGIAAASYGALGSLPYVGLAILAGEITHTAIEYGNSVYRKNRQIEFGNPERVSDPFGTMATMRQRSAYNLSRGRSALGNEARLFHS